MARQSRHGRFDVWVEIDGRRAEQYGDGVNGRTSTCFIISRNEAELAVYVQEFKSTAIASARADVYMDGKHIGKSVLSPSGRPAWFPGSWLDNFTLKPFVFTMAEKGSSVGRTSAIKDAGRIVVHISAIVPISKLHEDIDGSPPQLQAWTPLPATDDIFGLETHRIVLADTVKRAKYEPQHDIFDGEFETRPFDESDPEPIATFEFIYGPEEFVMHHCEDEPSSTPALHAGPCERPKANHSAARYPDVRASNKFSNFAPVSDMPSSSKHSKIKCTRCADAGQACIPNGGPSNTCQRCRRLRKGCNLPMMLQLSAKKRNQLDQSDDGESEYVPQLRHKIIRTYRRNSENNASQPSEQKATVIAPSEVTSTESTQSFEIVDKDVDMFENNYTRGFSPELEPDYGRAPSRAQLARVQSESLCGEELVQEAPGRDRDQTFNTHEGQGAEIKHKAQAGAFTSQVGGAMDVDPAADTAPGLAQTDTSNTSDTFHRNQILQTVRSLSDKLMEHVEGSAIDVNDPFAETTLQFVSQCDSYFRQLQAINLQNKMARKNGL
ncbi:uncharacterized protein FOMMEDRAFT_148310 [Fomitiporia mediterranea MF3/22]|uniref:uncharacterized protein n=1 Tax=Fomitiporia mediterranea (strain MF3/22) TaxID=694068 RepID=UPI00044095F1|nr:uncharacterized protein FOMMEDRAFT_148310 [Fomitiporia mediterranea MF3/22]EJD00625.1 hypothetical protein FOMMEDRAFT_148310 [Fomitiporia mediterranea MF3/22]